MHDPKEHMAGAIAKGIARPLRPPHRQAHAFCDAIPVRRQCRTFIKGHDNVRAQQLLDLHRTFGGQVVFGPVDMRFEGHALFGQLAQVRQAHHLKSAAIGENRTLPIHEFVQTAQAVDPLSAGAQHQVIGVAQQNIGPSGAHAVGHHALDGSCGANRHKSRGSDIAARGFDDAGAGLPILGVKFKRCLCHCAGLPHACALAKPFDASPPA